MNNNQFNRRPWEELSNDGWGHPLLDNIDQQDNGWYRAMECQRRAVEMMVRQVLRVKAGIYVDGIVDRIGSFIGGRLKGRALTGWSLRSRLITNPNMEE